MQLELPAAPWLGAVPSPDPRLGVTDRQRPLLPHEPVLGDGPLPCPAFLSQSQPLRCLWAEKPKEPFLCLVLRSLQQRRNALWGGGWVLLPGAGLGAGGAGGRRILSLPAVRTS